MCQSKNDLIRKRRTIRGEKVTYTNGDKLQFRELASPPAVQMIIYFMMFARCRCVRCNEYDRLIRVELKHAIVG